MLHQSFFSLKIEPFLLLKHLKVYVCCDLHRKFLQKKTLHFQVPVTSQTDVAVNASFCHIEPSEEAGARFVPYCVEDTFYPHKERYKCKYEIQI